LVQESTDPVWSKLIPNECWALLERDMPFLVWQIENLPCLEVVICTGKTVSEHLCRQVCVHVTHTGAMKRIRWWLGTAHFGQRDLPIGGWNYPLDRPTGLGTAGETDLGKVFAKGLL
jgi:hypothetical protein